MSINQRLFLAVLPGILGVLTVAGLAYWGQYGRQAPNLLVGIAIVASLVSLAVAWRTTREVAARVSRLAASGSGGPTDELRAIEDEVARLRQALADAHAEVASSEARADDVAREYRGLVADAAGSAARQLDEIRMPLHILLENRFGDLNENQEEMLSAARQAADEAQGALDRLRTVADIDRGGLRLRAERVRVGDLLAALMPALAADAARGGVAFDVEIAPLLPTVDGDRARLRRALDLVARDAVGRTPAGGRVRITARACASAPGIEMRVSHGGGPPHATDIALARRIIEAHRGSVRQDGAETVVSLPVADPQASSGCVRSGSVVSQ